MNGMMQSDPLIMNSAHRYASFFFFFSSFRPSFFAFPGCKKMFTNVTTNVTNFVRSGMAESLERKGRREFEER